MMSPNSGDGWNPTYAIAYYMSRERLHCGQDGAALDTVCSSPFTLGWVELLLAGFILLTDTHSRRYRCIAGPLHALAHITAALVMALGSIALVLLLTSPDWGGQYAGAG